MKIQEFGRKLSKIVKNLNFAIWKKEFSVIKMKKKQRSSFFSTWLQRTNLSSGPPDVRLRKHRDSPIKEEDFTPAPPTFIRVKIFQMLIRLEFSLGY